MVVFANPFATAMPDRALSAISSITKGETLKFAEFDQNGDQALDFEEFYAMQPRQILDRFTADELRVWFDEADKDGSGTLCVNEFFLWSLKTVAGSEGKHALQIAFERFDTDKTGLLDAMEFEDLAKSLGFGAVAHSIFVMLDEDGSGFLSYKEVIDGLTNEANNDPKTKAMLTTLALTHVSAQSGSGEEAAGTRKKKIDTTGWVIRGHGMASVRTELQRLLKQSGARVADLIALFDEDCDPSSVTIDDGEFKRAMHEFGYRGPQTVLYDIFRSMDSDNSGEIGFDELCEFAWPSPETFCPLHIDLPCLFIPRFTNMGSAFESRTRNR